MFVGVSKWFSKNIKSIKSKKEKSLERRRSTTVIMANKDGKLEEHKLPSDLTELVDPKKLQARQNNIKKMMRVPLSASVQEEINGLSRSNVFEKRQNSAY